jgi:polysaccharide pyruvyl transferase WcaK-like protein
VRIGVFGHVGNHNLGDEALIAAVVQSVRRSYPAAELRCFTGHPDDTEQRHGIPAFPIRRLTGRPSLAQASNGREADGPGALGAGLWEPLRAQLKRIPFLGALVRGARRVARATVAVPLELLFLAKSYHRLRGTALLLVAGSGQLNDFWGGPWGFPFTLFKWSLLARATGTKVAFLSLGAGPLRTPVGKFFVKQTLRLAHYRSYRDTDARRCIMQLGLGGEHLVVPDLVFGLHVNEVVRAAVRARPRMVGINAMPIFDEAYWPESDAGAYASYIRTLASFADWLVEAGYCVRFFATQLRSDPGVIDEVRARMRQDAGVQRINSFDELVSLIDSLDVVVATRYHGTVFALIRNKPVLSIAYQRKSIEVMSQVGQAQYAIEIDRLTPEMLRERFLALERHGSVAVEGVRRRLPAMRDALEAQYQRTFALIACGVHATE